MNNKNLDALFTGLTGTQISPASELPANQEPNVTVKNLDTERELSEEVLEERFCTIVQSDILRKIRIIAKCEGLQIKVVVNAAFGKAIKSYERKNGPVDGRMKGDAKNLF